MRGTTGTVMIADLRDEWIMAFADGELSAPLVSHVRAAIGSNAEAWRKYQAFLFTRPLAGDAFESILAEPVPERLTRFIARVRPWQDPSSS